MTKGIAIHLPAAFLAALFFSQPIQAAPHGEPVDCLVQLGFGNGKISYVPASANLVPLTITVMNDVASTAGRVEVTHQITGSPEVTEIMPFSSPKNSNKRFSMLTRNQPGLPTRVAVRFDKHLADVSRIIPVNPAKKPMVVCVGIPEGTELRKRIRKLYLCVDSPGAFLPDDPRAYEGLHGLALRGTELTRLAPPQIDAIRKWLVTGGRLLIMTPLNEQPFRQQASLLADQDAETLSQGGVHAVGQGMVCSGGISPQAENVFFAANKTEMVKFFELLEDEDKSQLPSFTSTSSSGLLKTLWSEQATSGHLGALWLTLIVGAYIFVIGPMDFLLVRKLKKPGFTWVVFLVGIVGFSIIAYGYTNFINIGEMRTVIAEIVDVDPARKIARGNAMVWVYSAKNANYEIIPEGENIHLSARESSQGVGSLAAVNILNGRQSIIETRIPIFSSKDFDAAWYMDWPYELNIEQDHGEVHLELPDDLDIASACLLSDSRLKELKQDGTRWSTTGGATVDVSALISSLNELSNWNQSPMPEPDNLKKYIQFISLQIKQQKEDDDWYYDKAYTSLNGKETMLRRTPLLQDGHRMLILYCKPTSRMLPITVKGGLPLHRDVCAIRILLPKET